MRAIQLLVTVLLFLHGAVHLLGVVKWGHLAPVPQLSGRTLVPLTGALERAFAGLWAAALVLLIAGAVLRVLGRGPWWAPALAGIALSQALVIMNWPDAKLGTVFNVLLLIPALAGAAESRFSERLDREVRTILAEPRLAAERGVITPDELRDLPRPVRVWLEQAGVVGKKRAQSVRVRQQGDLRTAPGAAWMPATAEQYFSIDPPAFVWRVQTSLFGFLPVVGRDLLQSGRGEMLIKAASLVNVVRAAGDKIDQGARLRFLGEMVWFPSAALEPYVSWQAIDSASARATMTSGGAPVSAAFRFDDDGRIIGLDAERYLGGGADAELTPWSVTCEEWARFHGTLVPTRGEVRWILPEGAFGYYRWQILSVEFDRPELFDPPAASQRARTTLREESNHASHSTPLASSPARRAPPDHASSTA